jgi:hypothetical protein
MMAASFSKNSMGSKRKKMCRVAPHRLEFDENAPVGAEADAVLGERGRPTPHATASAARTIQTRGHVVAGLVRGDGGRSDWEIDRYGEEASLVI